MYISCTETIGNISRGFNHGERNEATIQYQLYVPVVETTGYI